MTLILPLARPASTEMTLILPLARRASTEMTLILLLAWHASTEMTLILLLAWRAKAKAVSPFVYPANLAGVPDAYRRDRLRSGVRRQGLPPPYERGADALRR